MIKLKGCGLVTAFEVNPVTAEQEPEKELMISQRP
jgi:hypothetical protein